MKWSALLLVWLVGCSPKAEGPPGTLRGVVKFSGVAGEAVVVDMDQDPQCSKLYPEAPREEQPVAVSPEGKLRNVFVYLKTGLEGKHFEAPKTPVRIDQKGCWFEPRVIGMQAGQGLQVTNSDPVTHNIHPQAQVNREWNQSQAPEDGPLLRKFAKGEVMIRVKCNVHKWMRSWIGVVEHPFFAVTGADGSFSMQGVPPGQYTLAAWHEKLGTREQVVSVSPGGQVRVELEFRGQ
jgi:plastocyanin